MSEQQNESKREHKNVDQIREEDDKRFLYMVAVTLVVLGGGLIGFIYGWQGILTAAPCLFGGIALILIPWWLLSAYGRWRERMDDV